MPVGFKADDVRVDAIGSFAWLYADAWFQQVLSIPCWGYAHAPIEAQVDVWAFPGLEQIAKHVRGSADVTILITKQIVKDPPTYGTDLSMNVIAGEAPFLFNDTSRQIWGYSEFTEHFNWMLKWFPWAVKRFRDVMVNWEVGLYMTTPTFGVAMEESWHAISWLTGKGNYANDPHWNNRARSWYKDVKPGPEIIVEECSIYDPNVTFYAPKVPEEIRKKYR